MTVRVPFAASSVGVARQQLRAWMCTEGFARGVTDDARLVMSELVGNAVRHAQALPDGTLLVAWRHDREGIRISVTDGGSPSRPHAVRAPVSAVSGRGLAIVDAVAAQWWSDASRTRSTVHAVVAAG